jgi:hypothetical protein
MSPTQLKNVGDLKKMWETSIYQQYDQFKIVFGCKTNRKQIEHQFPMQT